MAGMRFTQYKVEEKTAAHNAIIKPTDDELFFFSSRRRHTRLQGDWSSDVCSSDLPDEVARLETAMWRSYYEKRRVQLFNQLAELLRTQYRMSQLRSNQVAYYGANAALDRKSVV